MTENILEIEDLRVKIGRKTILDDIGIQFEKKESVVIAGRNGSGKSTFLRCLANVIFPDRGRIVFSEGITKEKIGFISDQISLFENFTVKQGIRFHSSVFHIEDFNYTLIKELKFDLNQKIKNLSAGERTLYHLSLLLSQKPEILLIDEIIHTIDPYLREKFLEAIIELIDRCQTTVIMINHTFSEIEKIPERVLVMDKGQFILDEKCETLGEKIKSVVSEKEISEEIPYIFKRVSSFQQEYFIYPFKEEFRKAFPHEYKELSLNDIIKAFVGGQYVKEGN
ncbi:MAG: ABC transporter ATP-binding protein [Candidatus Aminicenantes bacterium]|nr:MAG: ABC transporter ATP-binding protein [Candidatus Aminicenantes bacterium]